jgi:hypothetical protein
MIAALATATEAATADSTAWERVVIALVPVMLALLALFNRQVRERVTGSSTIESDPQPDAAATAKTVAQTVSDGVGLQHLLVLDLQARLDKTEQRAQRLDDELDAAQREVADLRVVVAQLEAQIARWRAGWERP